MNPQPHSSQLDLFLLHHDRNSYSPAFGWTVQYIAIKYSWSSVSFKGNISLLAFCLDDLSIDVSKMLNFPTIGVPAVAQWDQQCLGSTTAQVPSSAQHRGLRIQRCYSCSLGHICGLDLIPGLGTPYAMGWPKKEKKKKFPIIVLLSGDMHFNSTYILNPKESIIVSCGHYFFTFYLFTALHSFLYFHISIWDYLPCTLRNSFSISFSATVLTANFLLLFDSKYFYFTLTFESFFSMYRILG